MPLFKKPITEPNISTVPNASDASTASIASNVARMQRSEIRGSRALNLISSTILIIFSSLLLFIQMLAPYFYPKQFGPFNLHYASSFLYFIVFTWIWSVITPTLANRFLLKEKLANLGIRKPQNLKTAALLSIAALIILAPIIYHFSTLPSFRAYYFLGNPTLSRIIFVDLLMMPLYYFAEEFFFRGFLFMGLWRRLGWHSFWITDIIFTLAHLNKPLLEILLSIPGSVIFNFITLKTKSIYPAVIVHTIIGIILNLSVAFAMAKY